MKNYSWEETQKKYSHWLSKCSLKKRICSEIKFSDLSIWWLTNLVNRDNVNNQIWYKDLHNILNNKKIEGNYDFFYIKFFVLLLKNLILKLLFTLFINFFLKIKNNTIYNVKNCYHSFFMNLTLVKGNYIDRHYGLTHFREKEKAVYLIHLFEDKNLIKNVFKVKKKLKKLKLQYKILNAEIKIFEIFKIYYLVFIYFLKILKLIKEKKYFLIEKKDCEKILKYQFLMSFAGSIQDQLLTGCSLKNNLDKSNFNNFISYMEFYPGARGIYYFAKKSNIKNIISINHTSYYKNDLFFSFSTLDFSKKDFSNYYSPHPDIFICQGDKYYQKLVKIFNKKKVHKVGNLKVELDNSLKIKFSKKKKKIKNNLLLLCNLNDYKPFIEILNQCNLKKFNINVLPHPYNINKTIVDFKKNFLNKFSVGNSTNRINLLKNADYVIFGNSSLGFQLAINKKNVIRIFDKKEIPTCDFNQEIPTTNNYKTVQKFLKTKNIKQNPKILIKNYFYKYDNKSSMRFVDKLKSI